MVTLNPFKKKEEEAPKEEKKVEKKEKPVQKTEKKEEKKVVKPNKTKGVFLNVLKSPHVTEKASDLTTNNQYVFKVYSNTNKVEIKKAVESLYSVEVINVRVINIHKKARRVGKTQGFRKGYKKAIVSLKQGQKIEILPR